MTGQQLTLKGAPEVVLGACAGVGPALKHKVREMAGEGLRVIGR